MPKLTYNREASSNPLFRVYLQDVRAVDGSGLTGLDSTSSGLRVDVIRELDTAVTSYTVAGSTIETITTIGTYAAPTATKCRFKAVDGTNMPGLYEIHLAQALTGTGDASRNLIVMIRGAANLIPCLLEIQLQGVDMEGAQVDANVTQIVGTAQSATDLKDFADTGYDPSTHTTAIDGTKAPATETYAVDGAIPTYNQFLFMIWSALAQFAISGTALSAKKLDGTTEAMVFTLDSATDPTSRVRSS